MASSRKKKQTPEVSEVRTIIALDLSLTDTGIAWWVLGDNSSLGFTNIATTETGPARLVAIRNAISVLSQNFPRPMLAFIENYAYSKGNQAHQMGELGGVIRTSLYDKDISYIVVSPTTIKKFLTGKGNAPKNVMLKDLYKHFKIDVDNDNEADAITLALLAKAYVTKKYDGLNKSQREVVENITFEEVSSKSQKSKDKVLAATVNALES